MMDVKNRRVLGIVGSPRRQGNTEILVDEVLSAAKEKGAEIEKVILGKLDIKPCRACNVCRDRGKCVHEDGMVGIIEQMREADAFVLGTPVYWWGPTAQFKAFLDRWYGIYGQGILKGKDTVLVIPLGGSSNSASKPILDMFSSIMSYLGMKHAGTVLASGTYEKGEAKRKSDLISLARELGSKLA
jgi:multimeric flavodoxin WrbA